MAASATLALNAGVWFRRARRCMVSPDSQATACPLSGRNSTYRPVQISGTSSAKLCLQRVDRIADGGSGAPQTLGGSGEASFVDHGQQHQKLVYARRSGSLHF